MVTQVGYSVAEQSRGRVTLCAVCIVHVETRSVSLLIEFQNQGRRFISGLALKPLGWFVSGLVSKPLGRFFPIWLQNWWRRFLLVWPQNRWWRVSRFGPQSWQLQFGDLCLKTNRVSVCRLRHKTDGWRTAWKMRRDLAACFTWKQVGLGFFRLASRLVEVQRWVVHVTPLQRLCRDQVEDE
jgi:hypothetical protein